MTKKRNVRSLDTIADSIHKLERGNIIDIGDLLIEAKAQCEHGHWLDWLETEFEWSVDTAERYMKAAELSSRFRTLRNLKLATTTLYKLADHDDEEELPAIISELSRHATEKQLKHKEAERVIKIGIGRHRHGDHPDATLVWLVDLDDSREESWYQQTVAELLKQNPETDEIASSIFDEVWQAHCEAERKAYDEEIAARLNQGSEDEREAEAILDGPPPELPSSIMPPEPQKFGADDDDTTEWAETRSLVALVKGLQDLRAKPITRFVGMFSPSELREVADFLLAIAEAEEKAKAEAAA